MSSFGSRQIAAELEALRAEQAAQRDLLLEIRQRLDARQPRRADPDRDARLLAAIAGALGSAIFSVADLMRQAASDRELAAVLDGADSRAIGVWLRRMKGRAIASYMLRRNGRDEGGALWTVAVCLDRHTSRRPHGHWGSR